MSITLSVTGRSTTWITRGAVSPGAPPANAAVAATTATAATARSTSILRMETPLFGGRLYTRL